MNEYTLVKDIARTYGPKTLIYCGANRGLIDFINDSRIRELQVETYSDNIKLYEGEKLGNHFSDFKKLLSSNDHIDHLKIPRPPTVLETEWEWDPYWVANDQSKFY